MYYSKVTSKASGQDGDGNAELRVSGSPTKRESGAAGDSVPLTGSLMNPLLCERRL